MAIFRLNTFKHSKTKIQTFEFLSKFQFSNFSVLRIDSRNELSLADWFTILVYNNDSYSKTHPGTTAAVHLNINFNESIN